MHISLNVNGVYKAIMGDRYYETLPKLDPDTESNTEVYLEVASQVLTKTLEYVPVDTGNLMNSVYIKPFGNGFEIGYDCDYAVYVHEIGFNYHEPPSQYKFLEDAAFEVIVDYYDETGIVIPVYIEYDPLRVFIGGENPPGQRLVSIKNKQVELQTPEKLNSLWEKFRKFKPKKASPEEIIYHQKMVEFFEYYSKQGKSSWSILLELADRMRHD